MAQKIIEVKDLKKYYNGGAVRALDGVTVDICKGEVIAVIGPSGGGKSTFLRSLNLLETPTSGTILVDGVEITGKKVDLPRHRQKMGMVFQHFNLFPHKSVLENLTMAPIHIKGMEKEQAEQKAMELLSRVGLADRAGAYPAQLSGGQKQRVAIAGMLAMRPEVLILDEPTAGLDPRGCEDILSLLRAYHTRRGSTVVLVSHSMEEIARSTQRIIVLDRGGVRMEGTPAQVFARARELEAVGLDVPQVTKIAHALHEKGVAIDPAVYTVEALQKQLLALKGGHAVC